MGCTQTLASFSRSADKLTLPHFAVPVWPAFLMGRPFKSTEFVGQICMYSLKCNNSLGIRVQKQVLLAWSSEVLDFEGGPSVSLSVNFHELQSQAVFSLPDSSEYFFLSLVNIRDHFLSSIKWSTRLGLNRTKHRRQTSAWWTRTA